MATDKIAFADKDRFSAPPINIFRAADAQEIKTVVNKLRDETDELYARTVSVKDYGAVGDGTTDDTAAIQDALDNELYLNFEDCEYLISDTLTIKSETMLIGKAGKSIIKLADNSDCDIFTNENFGTPGDTGIKLINLILDGNKDNNTGTIGLARFDNVTNLEIFNVEGKESQNYAFYLQVCEAFNIHHCYLHDGGDNAINFRESDYSKITNNKIHDFGSKTVVGVGGHAIADFASGDYDDGSFNVIVDSNMIYDMGDSCIRNNNGQGWIITNNVIVRGGKDSIKCMANDDGVDPVPEYNVIANNYILDAGNDGIVYSASNGIIKGNMIYGTGKNTGGASAGKYYPSSSSGIQIGEDSINVLIDGNMIIDAFRTGIRATRGNNVKIWIINNTVTLSGQDGIRFQDIDDMVIRGNFVFNNGVGRTGETMTAATGIRSRNLTSCSNWIIKDNFVYDDQVSATQEYGIYLQDVGGNTITNLIVEDNIIQDNNTADVSLAYTPSRISNNAGYLTENSGTATIASGDTHIDVTHGLAITPEAANISVTPTNSMGDSAKYYISDIGATTFRINVNADPGATTATFAWQIN
jgi:hypothetical protein